MLLPALLLHIGHAALSHPLQPQPAAIGAVVEALPEGAAPETAQLLTDCAAAAGTTDPGAGMDPAPSAPQQQQLHQQQQYAAGWTLQQPAMHKLAVEFSQQQGPLEAAQQAAAPAPVGPATPVPLPDAAPASRNSNVAATLHAPPDTEVSEAEVSALVPASAVSPAGVLPSPAEAAALGLPHYAHAEQGSDAGAETAAVDEQPVELQRPGKRRRRGNWAKVGRKWVHY